MSSSARNPDLGDDAIRKGSGKSWAEWVEILDAWGGREQSHAEIARHVAALGVDDWWAQGVTVGYERIVGKRVVGQRSDGRFSGSASGTCAADALRLSACLTKTDSRRRWLQPDTLHLRTAKPGTSARFDQKDSA